jgi:alcohol dehydrogenase class IV
MTKITSSRADNEWVIHEDVAGTPHGFNVSRLFSRVLQFLPQAADQDIYRAGQKLGIDSPQFVQNLVARKRATRIFHK